MDDLIFKSANVIKRRRRMGKWSDGVMLNEAKSRYCGRVVE
jgi:hypothetical protein